MHWEANGLLDIERNPRVFHHRFPAINADIVIVPGLARRAFWTNETLELAPSIAAGGRTVPAGARLEWRLGEASGAVAAPAVAPLEAAATPPLAIPLPALAEARKVTLELALVGADGARLAENSVTVALHPRLAPADLTVGSDDPKLTERLTALGYAVAPEATAGVFVTRRLDPARIDAISAGQRVVQLAEPGTGQLRDDEPPREPPALAVVDDRPGIPSTSYFTFPGYSVADRRTGIWRGDWIGNFSWVRRDGAFAGLPGGPLIDLSFDRVVPRALISGSIRPWEFDGRVHGGLVVGWVHKPAATIIEKPHGRGRLVATTFRLEEDGPGADPTATVLFDGLLRLAGA